MLHNSLSMREVEELTAEVDRLNEESQRQGRDPHSFFDVMDIIETARERTGNGRSLQTKPNEVFLNLIDHPNHLGIVCDLMGAAIQLTASQMMIRPPIPTPSREWHQDSAPPYGFPKVHDRVPLQQFRIGIATDMDKPDIGNLCVIPGSHRNEVSPATGKTAMRSQLPMIGSQGARPGAAAAVQDRLVSN